MSFFNSTLQIPLSEIQIQSERIPIPDKVYKVERFCMIVAKIQSILTEQRREHPNIKEFGYLLTHKLQAEKELSERLFHKGSNDLHDTTMLEAGWFTTDILRKIDCFLDNNLQLTRNIAGFQIGAILCAGGDLPWKKVRMGDKIRSSDRKMIIERIKTLVDLRYTKTRGVILYFRTPLINVLTAAFEFVDSINELMENKKNTVRRSTPPSPLYSGSQSISPRSNRSRPWY